MMQNLARVLLISSALVAISAPSAFAIPADIATAAASQNGTALVGSVNTELATLGANATLDQKKDLVKAAIAACPTGNQACVLAILTAFATGPNVKLSQAEITTAAAAAGVTFTAGQLPQEVIGAVGTGGGGTTNNTPDSSGGQDATTPPSGGTGTPVSPT